MFIVLGDFNEVRFEYERLGSKFCKLGARRFNEFIFKSGLIDLPMGERKFTRMNKFGTKLSKIDRIMVSHHFVSNWPNAHLLALPHGVSDHCPLVLKATRVTMVRYLSANVEALETKAETIGLEDHENSNRLSYLKQLDDLEHIKRLDLMQKAKIKWAIEGVEKSKFFHGFINNRFAKSRIKAVWSCGGGKALGPDGFTSKFIKQYWETIRIDFINMVKRFKIDGEIPRGCNSSFIALAWKIQDPLHIKDYRPISLIGCEYKVIAKAIDSLDWKFLDHVLEQMGFSNKWRKLINGCLDSGFSSKLVNVSPTKEFKVQKGLRQGDPLSSFLFIIVVEALHISLQVSKEINIFEGVEVGHNKINISHLQFADDALIMGKRSLENAKNLCHILSLQALNLAMLAKWWWRFNYETNSVWKNTISSIYVVRGGLGLEAQPQCRLMSTFWNSIIGLRKFLLHLNINLDSVFVRKVGNRASVKFWEETWYGNTPFKDVYPILYALESSKSCDINERCNNSLGPLTRSWA
uniref:RNA-directed DNA polymerase, eukaryota n=1 Tax=Tanacetum cinerariifolium TaxID=118510 RepID=A0A699I776_TANCI|nr:RNA-directed DNA polymerase, eukaryota [Tanacetum cinerariifolium]